jgi:4'-phosphopantetheinyl transferase EntD
MELLAISDLHVGFAENRRALQDVRPRRADWLILAGDTAETARDLELTLDLLAPRFGRLVWCPGNHDLWTRGAGDARGQEKYEQLVEICRRRDVLTPEDDYAVWEGAGERLLIAPLFLLYDYSFRPDHIRPADAPAWAAAAGIICVDEYLLHPDPYPSLAAWCAARCAETERRLERAVRETGLRTVLINHFPLKQCLARVPAAPRFQVWCGTRRTEDWHLRFHAAAVVSGHLHLRTTTVVDGCRFEEVSLGYPHRQWRLADGIDRHLRRIAPVAPDSSATRPRARGNGPNMPHPSFHDPPLRGRSQDTWIGPLFSSHVVTAEAHPSLVDQQLFPEELAVLERAVPKRRAEFGTARVCARHALARLGIEPTPLVPHQDRSPRWPPGIVGSISHTTGYCGVALARSELIHGVGLDVEEDRHLDPELVDAICTPDERRLLAMRGRARQDAIVYFSAKEAFYKCQFPLTGTFLDFRDVVLDVDFERGTFRAGVLRPLLPHHAALEAVSGRFLRQGGLVLCGFELRARASH